ncbi:MAG: tRNA threonylcarbamoyladenosine dehydratase [Eubacteriales bacterium]|nr:tRNA threonylcarbamoyladenosine dehydratase [Eubacteriales bacterium]MDD4716928.1 tRNA threonylcarbamoyladenosine dehydratase [Eubacteriales bacterium]
MIRSEDRFIRSRMVLGEENMAKLAISSVAVFGLGGVGGPAAEALARSGVGKLYLIDGDTVALSNINRQIIAFESTVGRYKTQVMMERIKDIDPAIEVVTFERFLRAGEEDVFPFDSFDYVIDAIDTVSAKVWLAEKTFSMNIPIISSMGMGNRIDPTAIRLTDVFLTSGCPLARTMRRELKLRGVSELKVVFSDEIPAKVAQGERVPGSVSFVPPVAGYILAGEAVRCLIGQGKRKK